MEVYLPLYRHHFPQSTYLLATVHGAEQVHSDEGREQVTKVIDEMEVEMSKIDSVLHNLGS